MQLNQNTNQLVKQRCCKFSAVTVWNQNIAFSQVAPGTYRQAFLLQLKPPKNLEGEILLFPLCVRIDVYLTFYFWASSSFIPQVVPIVEKEVREQKFLAI